MKERAWENIASVLVTLETSHADRSWSKDFAIENTPYILVTPDTSHVDRSWLNDCILLNIKLISVTPDTFHDPIGPFGPAGQSPMGDSPMHKPTASRSSVLLRGANAVVPTTTKALSAMIHTRVLEVQCVSQLSCDGLTRAMS